MANIFHKSCYTTRTTGYKYRTLATNTTDSEASFWPSKPRKSSKENPLDKKFRDIKNEIISRVTIQVQEAQRARAANFEKFERIMEKIDETIELKESIVDLQKSLCQAEDKLAGLARRVERLSDVLRVPE